MSYFCKPHLSHLRPESVSSTSLKICKHIALNHNVPLHWEGSRLVLKLVAALKVHTTSIDKLGDGAKRERVSRVERYCMRTWRIGGDRMCQGYPCPPLEQWIENMIEWKSAADRHRRIWLKINFEARHQSNLLLLVAVREGSWMEKDPSLFWKSFQCVESWVDREIPDPSNHQGHLCFRDYGIVKPRVVAYVNQQFSSLDFSSFLIASFFFQTKLTSSFNFLLLILFAQATEESHQEINPHPSTGTKILICPFNCQKHQTSTASNQDTDHQRVQLVYVETQTTAFIVIEESVRNNEQKAPLSSSRLTS